MIGIQVYNTKMQYPVILILMDRDKNEQFKNK